MTCGNRPNRTPWRRLPPAPTDPFDGLLVGSLDGLRKQLSEAAEIAADDGKNAGKWTQSHDADPDQRPDQGIDAADGIEAAARQEVDDAG